jgi:fused signal recognition particle receptor
MFGSLKRKLKEAIAKVAGKVEPSEAAAPPAVPKREEPVVHRPAEPVAERIEEELEKRVEEIKELEQKVEEESIPEQVAAVKEEKQILEEVRQEVRKVEIKAEAKAAPPKKRLGILQKIKEKEISESDLEKILSELQLVLLESDVAVEVADRINDHIRGRLLGNTVKRGKVEEIIREALKAALLDVMKQEAPDIEALIRAKEKEPLLVMLFGFNGVGKTTQASKLAHKFKKYKPILAAGDTFRAASIEQLEEHGRRLGVDVVKHKYGSDSAAVIFDAVKHAKSTGSKLVLADTAGRSHADVNLMDELKKVVRVNKPDLKVLVLDSLTGNDIFDQARLFNDAVGVDAIIMTKADVYEKGGAAISAAWTIKKPILFLGTGQGYEDLQPFDAEKIVKGLLG